LQPLAGADTKISIFGKTFHHFTHGKRKTCGVAHPKCKKICSSKSYEAFAAKVQQRQTPVYPAFMLIPFASVKLNFSANFKKGKQKKTRFSLMKKDHAA